MKLHTCIAAALLGCALAPAQAETIRLRIASGHPPAVVYAGLMKDFFQVELKKREDATAAYNATKDAINFGSQMRNYVLAPYRLVKDVRTSHETSQVDTVLDGDLDPFIESYLMAAAGGTLRKGGIGAEEDGP